MRSKIEDYYIRSFFDRQKRDLSHKSNGDDERKKAGESSLNVPLCKDEKDIFVGGNRIPTLCWYFMTTCKIWGKKVK